MRGEMDGNRKICRKKGTEGRFRASRDPVSGCRYDEAADQKDHADVIENDELKSWEDKRGARVRLRRAQTCHAGLLPWSWAMIR